MVLKKHPRVQFNFAGLDEDSGATDALKNLAQENDLSNNINFLGAVSGDQKLKLLGEAGVIILPSYGENMPISVLEGMAAWKPIITTRVGAIPEVITDNKNGILIDAGDWQALGEKLIDLFKNPNKALKVGQKAGETVREKWDVDKIMLVYKQIYKDLHL